MEKLILLPPGVPLGSVVGPGLGLDVVAIIFDLVSDILVVVAAASAGAFGAARVVAAAHFQRQGGRQVDRLALALIVLKNCKKMKTRISLKKKNRLRFRRRICCRRDQD